GRGPLPAGGALAGGARRPALARAPRLEVPPRGVSCGALGVLAPGAAGGRPRASLSVALRTVVVDRTDGSAVYGAGGGVTWQSTADGEYDELLAKAAVLPTGQREPFALLETFAVADGRARHLAHHLRRLRGSAEQLRVRVDEA